MSEAVEPKKTIRAWVYARVRLGLCINHEGTIESARGKSWCKNKARLMGVCDRHYGQVRRAIDGIDPQQAERIRDRLAYEGQMLSPQAIRSVRRKSVVASIARRVVENTNV